MVFAKDLSSIDIEKHPARFLAIPGVLFPRLPKSEDPVPVGGCVSDDHRDDHRQYDVIPGYPENHLLIPPILPVIL